MNKERSLGVITFSLFCLGFSIYNFTYPLRETQWIAPPQMQSHMAFAVLFLIMGVGLFMLANWSRIVFIIFSIFKASVHAWSVSFFFYCISVGKIKMPSPSFYYHNDKAIISALIAILWLIPFYFFTRHKVSDQFSGRVSKI